MQKIGSSRVQDEVAPDMANCPANVEHLHRSIAQFKAGKVSQRDLIDE